MGFLRVAAGVRRTDKHYLNRTKFKSSDRRKGEGEEEERGGKEREVNTRMHHACEKGVQRSPSITLTQLSRTMALYRSPHPVWNVVAQAVHLGMELQHADGIHEGGRPGVTEATGVRAGFCTATQNEPHLMNQTGGWGPSATSST